MPRNKDKGIYTEITKSLTSHMSSNNSIQRYKGGKKQLVILEYNKISLPLKFSSLYIH